MRGSRPLASVSWPSHTNSEEARVLVKENPAKSNSRRRPSSNPAQQAALALREEFGVPFTLFDPATGAELLESKNPARLELDATDLAEMLGHRKALVHELANGSFRLCLTVQGPDQTLLVAHGELAGIAPRGTPEAERERARLQKWLQAVADRLHIADKFLERRRTDTESSQAAGSWEAILTLDRLIRRLRVHKQ